MASENILMSLSDALAAAVETGGASTVMVAARRRLPASGIVYAPGLVLTAGHVIEREEDIPVGLPDGSEARASLAGRDPGSDLAVLRLSEGQGLDLQVAQPAPGSPRVGQMVLALGRPSQAGIQASLGSISAVSGPVPTGHGAMLDQYLRTDTIPYPGFSGGPLVDASGRVVGLNTSGLARGMSLTIPAGFAWQVASALAEGGGLRRGYLGIRSQPVELPDAARQALGRDQESGLLLVGVEKDSPAERGGLMVGDILVAIQERSLEHPDNLLVFLGGPVAGKAVPVEVLRGGQRQSITVTIGER